MLLKKLRYRRNILRKYYLLALLTLYIYKLKTLRAR